MEFQSLTVEVKASISDYSILELSKAPFMVHLAGRVYEEDLGETSGLPIRSVSVLSSKGELLTLKIHGDLSNHELLVVGQPLHLFYVDIKPNNKSSATAFMWSDSYLLSAGPVSKWRSSPCELSMTHSSDALPAKFTAPKRCAAPVGLSTNLLTSI